MDLAKWYQQEIDYLYWILLELYITSGQIFCQYWKDIVIDWPLHFQFSETHSWINDSWLVSLMEASINILSHNGLQPFRSILVITLSFVPKHIACCYIVLLSFIDIIWKKSVCSNPVIGLGLIQVTTHPLAYFTNAGLPRLGHWFIASIVSVGCNHSSLP